MNQEDIKEMMQIVGDYQNAVDNDLLNFIKDVMSERDVLPITVGFVSEAMGRRIEDLTGLSTTGNRIVVSADDIRHIINRHGENGVADHSMADIRDIARLSYVLANYDSIEWKGDSSHAYRTKDGSRAPQVIISKRINGTYYVVEIVSDGTKNRNYVTTAYLKKATD